MRDASIFALNARRQLAQELRAHKILSVPRPSALLTYLFVLEAESVRTALFSPGSRLSTFGAHRQAVESSAHAIPAIFEQCPPEESIPAQVITPELFNLAHDFFAFTCQYDQIDYAYKLADWGHFDISVAKKNPRITFSYASPQADEADTLAKAREVQARVSGKRPSLDSRTVSETIEELRAALAPQTRLIRPEYCEYFITDGVLSAMRKQAGIVFQAIPVGMDLNVNVGQSAFDDFRAFWSALLSFIQTHTMAHELACGGNVTQFPIQSIVIRKQKSEMIELLSSIGGLSYRTAEFILGCYLYDPKVNGRGPVFQPFLPVTGDYVCLSSLLVAGYDFERNFFKLLHRSPVLLPFAASIDSQKEPIALRHLCSLFSEPDYATKECVKIPGRTDVDLLVYERRSGFTLIIQHKWLTAPETPEESSSNDERLHKGVTQSITARDYFRSNHKAIRDALKLSASAPINRVECATVCRGLEGTSFMEPSDVPILMEQAFEGLFRHVDGLEKLWNALLSRPDKKLAATKVVDGTMTIQLGEYEFVLPALGIRG